MLNLNEAECNQFTCKDNCYKSLKLDNDEKKHENDTSLLIAAKNKNSTGSEYALLNRIEEEDVQKGSQM